jgi:predicted NBD/HSP70 family sugar kinase
VPEKWAIGADLGGTKVEVAQVDTFGRMYRRLVRATEVKDGPAAVEAEIIAAVRELQESMVSPRRISTLIAVPGYRPT